MISRRALLEAGAAAVAGLRCGVAGAQPAWPDKPVLLINGFGAGGASDVLTRMVAEKLQARFNQTFIVEDRSGAGGNIAMRAVMSAAPDGYTVGSATIGNLAINQYLYTNFGYDPAQAFACVSTFWESTNLFVVASTNPARTLKEFLDWARAKPDGVTYSSSGVGTTPHLAGELFRVRTGLKVSHVPFRGGTQPTADLVSGRIDFSIDNIVNQAPMLRSGKMRALAVTSAQRWPQYPEVPTMAEAGVPDFVMTSWGAMVVPAATPVAIVNTLSKACHEIAAQQSMQERFLQIGARITSGTPQETTEFVARERVKWKEVVRLSGAKID